MNFRQRELNSNFDRSENLAYGWVVNYRPNDETTMAPDQEQEAITMGIATPVLERRASCRYSILQRCIVRVGNGADDSRSPGGWSCIAYNISQTGIGLTLPLPLPPGSVLEIEPWGLPAARVLRVCVARTVAVEFAWFCGCHLFEPLTPEELNAWSKGRRDWLPRTPAGRFF